MVSLQKRETRLKENALKVKKEAENLVAKARAKAGKICDEARLMGDKKGKELMKDGLLKAQKEAQIIEKESIAKIGEIQKQAQANHEQAITLIVDRICGKNRANTRIKDKNVSANG